MNVKRGVAQPRTSAHTDCGKVAAGRLFGRSETPFPFFSRRGTPFAGRDGFKLSTAVSREKKCFTYSFSSGLPVTLALPLRARVGGGGWQR